MSSQSPDTDGIDFVSPTANWASMSKHVLNSYVEANTALLATMGLTGSEEPSTPSLPDDATIAAPASEHTLGDENWTMERSADEIDALDVGDYVRFRKPITDADTTAFAQVSGDTNQLHLESEFPEETQFDGRIATARSSPVRSALHWIDFPA